MATVALEFPQHRIGMSADLSRELSRRTVRLDLPGLHLWLAHPGAIWTTDPSDGTPTRACAGATAAEPGVLRDDRDRLTRVLNLARQWYRTPRRSLRYSMKAVGTMPDADGGTTYPGLGDLVTTVTHTTATGRPRR